MAGLNGQRIVPAESSAAVPAKRLFHSGVRAVRRAGAAAEGFSASKSPSPASTRSGL